MQYLLGWPKQPKGVSSRGSCAHAWILLSTSTSENQKLIGLEFDPQKKPFRLKWCIQFVDAEFLAEKELRSSGGLKPIPNKHTLVAVAAKKCH